tara:strand:- start:4979 stop:5503 length:525 start_codon:yes stop_codon:yes gene_type:complete
MVTWIKWTIWFCFSAIAVLVLLLTSLAIAKPSSALEVPSKDVVCMAEAIYYEARNQSSVGQLAVAIVIRNRMKDKRWPSTACGVVKDGRYWKGNPIRDKCQFSYWCDGKPERFLEKDAWERALNIAHLAYYHSIEIEDLMGATHYHTIWVQPSWAKKFRLSTQIGDHRFYESTQ